MIIAVSGVPRSGTSVMMQMLAAGGLPLLTDDRRKADEDNPRGYYEWTAIKRLPKEPAIVSEAEGKAVKIVSSLLMALPPRRDYQVIFMERPLAEVVASQNVMIQRRETKGAALPPEAMAAALANHLNRVRAWLARRPEIQLCRVEYLKLLEDPLGESERMRTFLGADLYTEAMARQVDPSLHRQRGGE